MNWKLHKFPVAIEIGGYGKGSGEGAQIEIERARFSM